MYSLSTLARNSHTVSIVDDAQKVRAAQQLRTDVFSRRARRHHARGVGESGRHPVPPWRPARRMLDKPGYAHLPLLRRGCLRLDARVCGPPARDADFGVADYFVLLPLDRVDDRYRRIFLGAAQ